MTVRIDVKNDGGVDVNCLREQLASVRGSGNRKAMPTGSQRIGGCLYLNMN